MKAEIDRGGCISCGLCVSICPEVFRIGDDGPAEVCDETIQLDAENSAVEAKDGCPVSVIAVE